MKGIFLDTETNGLNVKKHLLVEVAFKILDLLNGNILDEYQSLISPPYDLWKHSDPESLKINGFTWDEVHKGNHQEEVADGVKETFKRNGITRGEAVFICQNPSFDRAFISKLIDPDMQEKLLWPYHWLDLASMHFARSIHEAKEGSPYPWDIGFSKDSIATYYKIPEEEKPHRAMNGVNHLILCYQGVIGYPLSQK